MRSRWCDSRAASSADVAAAYSDGLATTALPAASAPATGTRSKLIG